MPLDEVSVLGRWRRPSASNVGFQTHTSTPQGLRGRPSLPNPLTRLYGQDAQNMIKRKAARDLRKLTGKALIQSLAPRLALRAVPIVGTLVTIFSIYDYWNRERNTGMSTPGGFRPDPSLLFCGTQGGPLNGTGAFSCGFEHLHHKSHDNHWHYYVADNTYRIASVPNNTWSLDSNYWDSRTPQPGVLAVWKTAPGDPRPPDETEKPAVIYDNPWDDPGPAPAPQPDIQPSRQPLPRVIPPGPAPTPLPPPVRRTGRVDPFFNPEPLPEPATETAPKFDRSPPPANTLPPAAPTVTFRPGHPTRTDIRPHRRQKPNRRTKERKIKGYIARGSVLMWALGTATEGLDILYCFYDALPSKYRKSRYKNDRALLNSKWTNTTIRRKAGTGHARTKFIKRPPPLEAWRRINDYMGTGDFYNDPFDDNRLVDQERYMNRVFTCIVINGVVDIAIGLAHRFAQPIVSRAERIGGAGIKYDFHARQPLTGINPINFLSF